MMIQALSILIPTYNDRCFKLVGDLRQQAESCGILYEILVGDDGSTDASVISDNQAITQWPNCRFLCQPTNIGRAAIRNFLVREARYDYVLFIDSDMTVISSNFMSRYLSAGCDTVTIGGVAICGDDRALRGNLRYRYERAEAPKHTAPERQKTPYQHLHTANLLIRRDLILQYPFDERFRHYGYEDVLLGKTLRKHHVPITHIDNPLGFSTFEDNATFLAKTEEGLRTLHTFRNDLRGYSRLLTLADGIHLSIVRWLICRFHTLFNKIERRILCSAQPNLTVFKLYRLGYFLCLRS
jgi:glycosyltransferase involved in cell wall biosynthesis